MTLVGSDMMNIFKSLFEKFQNNNKKDEATIQEVNELENLKYSEETVDTQQHETISEEIKMPEEKVEYQMPDINLIKDESLRNAILKAYDNASLRFLIGLDESNEWEYIDICKMPNLLIGGTVMSGKTNLINLILLNVISVYSPDEVRLIIADAKGLDYNSYNRVSHLLTPVVKSCCLLKEILEKETQEMANRYTILRENNKKTIHEYNAFNANERLPYHLIVIDDYSIFNSSDLDSYIASLGSEGWRVGIHLIVVANNPDTSIMSTVSKINFPARLSFRVPSVKDSKVILDQTGAESLTEIGSFLISLPYSVKLLKLHNDLIDDRDIDNIINDIASKNRVVYKYYVDKDNNLIDKKMQFMGLIDPDTDDLLYEEACKFVVKRQKASISLLQREFRIGYNRAARLIDLLEYRGVIGSETGSTEPREVLITDD